MKNLKSVKLTWLGAGFGVCKGLVVVIRGGCRGFGDLKLKVFDLESKRSWYLFKNEGLSDFLIVGVRVNS